MNSVPFYKGMKKHFGITHGANEYIDEWSVLRGKLSIDVIKFDGWLHEQIGEYEIEEGLNMREAIAKHFGTQAMRFVEGYL